MLANITEIRSWYNYRRKRFWVLLLAVIYTLTGFFVVPWALQKQTPDLSQNYLHRDATIGKVTFNPWMLKLQINNFALLDENGSHMVEFDSLLINLQVSSLFRWALVFHEISLNSPTIKIVRYTFADSNIGRMLNDIEAASTTDTDSHKPNEASSVFHLKVANLSINNGIIDLHDELRAETFSTRIEPINISVSDLSTLPNIYGTQQVHVTTENGVELTWTGSLELNPLISAGRLEMNGSPLPVVYRYFEQQLGFTLDNCCFQIELNYSIDSLPDGSIAAKIDNLEALLSNVVVQQRDTDETVLKLPTMRLGGGSLAWPEQTIRIDEFVIEQPEFYIWINQDKSLNLDKLILAEEEVEPERVEITSEPDIQAQIPDSATSGPEEPLWDIELGEFRIEGMKFNYADHSLSNPGDIGFSAINLSLSEITNQPGVASPLLVDATVASGGQIGLVGKVSLLPVVRLDAKLNVHDFALQGVQPWAEAAAHVLIEGGTFNLAGALSSSPEEIVNFSGDMNIAELSISDTLKNETLLGWKKLSFDQTHLQLDAGELEISLIKLVEPFARVIIAADGSTNFQSLATRPDSDNTAPADSSDSDNNIAVRIGRTQVENGSIDFSDYSLPLPFRVLINEFGGTMSTTDSTSQQPSTLDFEGRVGDYGLTTLGGAISIMAPTSQADIQLDFRNLNMPDLSPYTVQFAGRKIANGKLNLGLNYIFEDQHLVGDNNIILTDFELGEKVDHEDAMSLPLDLAIALLTDINGVIDLDLRISGDIDDPDFSASGIVFKAFANLIIKAVAAPFKLLGGLVPGGGEIDLNTIEFMPGRADLLPPEQEKLIQLSAALVMRPSLTLQINGGYNREIDAPALQQINIENQVNSLIGEISTEPGKEQSLTRKIRKALEKLAKQQLNDTSLRALRTEFKRENPQTGKWEFDEVAYMAELRSRLEAVQPIDDNYLDTLGRQRSDMIVAFLTSLGELDSAHLTQKQTLEVDAGEDDWIGIPLDIEISEITSVQTPVPQPDEAALAPAS
jgi:hypothetical protein